MMPKIRYISFIFLISYLSVGVLSAKNNVKDSLVKFINQPNNHDTSTIQGIIKLGEYFYRVNHDSAKYYWEKALNFANENTYENKQINEVMLLQKARAYNNLGAVTLAMADNNSAIKLFIKSLQIKEELSDKKGIGKTANNIGYLLGLQGDNAGAIKYLQISLKVRNEINDSAGISQALHNIGYIFYTSKKLDSALIYYQQSLVIREKLKLDYQAANSYNNIGLIYYDRKEYPEAKRYFNKAMIIFEGMNDEYNLPIIYANLSSIYSSQLKKDTAEYFAYKAYRLAEKLEYPEALKTCANVLYNSEKRKGNYKKALDFYELHIQMKDSIRNQDTEKVVLRAQLNYENQLDSIAFAKQHEIDSLQIKTQEAETKSYRIKMYGLGAGSLLLIALLIVVFKGLKQKQRDNQLIKEQKSLVEKAKAIIEEKNHEIGLSISYAELIQTAVFPKLKSTDLFNDSFILFKPRDVVSGDFYWMEQNDRFKFITAVDCTGHGIPGAFISMIGTILLNEIYNSKKLFKPVEILQELDRLIRLTLGQDEDGAKLRDGMDIAFCVYDTQDNVLHYAGANNPLWMIKKGAAELIEIKGDKKAIGGRHDGEKQFTQHDVKLNKGDTFYIFSDGYADQFGGEKAKKFKTANFKKLLVSIQKEDMFQQHKILDQHFDNWKGELDQIDDVCVVGVRI